MKACYSKRIKYSIVLLVVCFLTTCMSVLSNTVNATNDSWRYDEAVINYPKITYEELSEQEKIIWKYYDTVNLRDESHPDGDWETRVSLTDISNREFRKSFSENSKNRSLHMGIFNLRSCQIVYIEKIDNSPGDINETEGLTIETYMVGMLCDVYEDEDLFTFDGVNFDEVLICSRENVWYILENRGVSTEQLKTVENSSLIADAISFSESNRMNASAFNPLQNRPELADIYEDTNSPMLQTSTVALENAATVLASAPPMQSCNSNVQPSNIYVVNQTRGAVSIVNFDTYVKRVLQREMGYSYSSVSGLVSGLTEAEYTEGLKANAMAVKMFSWWCRTIYTKHKSEGAHICNTDHCQVYPGDTTVDSFISNAFDSICNVGIRTDTGWILFAQYRAGNNWTSAGDSHKGMLYQKGAYYLASQGYTYKKILSYYYASVPEEIEAPYPAYEHTISRGALRFFTAIH